MRLFLLLNFLLFSIVLFSQEDEDSTFLVQDFELKDTLQKTHFGFEVGLSHNLYNLRTNSDSVILRRNNNNFGFNVGFNAERKINNFFSLQSGMRVNISSILFKIQSDSLNENLKTPYSNLEIPFNLVIHPHPNKFPIRYLAGTIFTADITKKDDKELRLLELKPNNIFIDFGIEYTYKNSSGTRFNTSLIYKYGLFNLIKNKKDNFISKQIEDIHFHSIALIFSIN
jgi:hypothetical protein